MPGSKTRLKITPAPPVDNPQPKKRGGQKITLATKHDEDVPNNGQSTMEPPAQQQPKKRSRQAAATLGNVEDAPPAKKGRKVKATAAANDFPVDEPAPNLPVAKATRPTRVTTKSAKAVSNSQVVPKRPRRTKEEVAADKEAQLRAAEELIRKADEAKAFLAQLNVDEEQVDVRMEIVANRLP